MRSVAVERAGDVVVVRLERAERHNSLVPEFLGDLGAALVEACAEPMPGALVLEAAGRTFSTGGDVRGFWDHRDDLATYAARVVGGLNETILDLLRCPVPTVAAVHGMVTGGSLGLVLACDVVLVGTAATFRPWYATVGFAPDGGWTAMLPAVVGSPRTADVLLRDREIDAETAVAWGMASELVEGDVRAAAGAVAARIAAAKRGAVGHVLGRLRGDVGSIAVGLEDERRRFVEQIVTAEAREGMAAFLGV